MQKNGGKCNAKIWKIVSILDNFRSLRKKFQEALSCQEIRTFKRYICTRPCACVKPDIKISPIRNKICTVSNFIGRVPC